MVNGAADTNRDAASEELQNHVGVQPHAAPFQDAQVVLGNQRKLWLSCRRLCNFLVYHT
jgi:hypothetical protein